MRKVYSYIFVTVPNFILLPSEKEGAGILSEFRGGAKHAPVTPVAEGFSKVFSKSSRRSSNM